MLIQTAQLDQDQLNALDALCTDCKATDDNRVAIYRHLLGTNRHRPASLLYFDPDSKKLIGFLAAFFFLENTCEIALMIAPDYRRRGIATQLLKRIHALTQAETIQHMVFSSPHGLNDHWFTELGLHYKNSEFEMRRAGHQRTAATNRSVQIRIATDADIPTLCVIDNACFPKQTADTPARIHRLIHDSAHSIFVIKQENQIVGKAHLNWQSNGTRLSDIAIIPSRQGCGLGKALIAHCINHALENNSHDIFLDVETTNKNALQLYTHFDFSITNAHDYWGIDEFGLTGFLHPL